MTDISTFPAFGAQLREFIKNHSGAITTNDDVEFNQLAIALFKLQFEHNQAYRSFCAARKINAATVNHWRDIPAMPTAGFKELELTSLPLAERTSVFHSSGTTAQFPGRHFHSAESVAIYEASLVPWFAAHFPVSPPPTFLILTPAKLAANSSLVHMFAILCGKFGSPHSIFVGELERDGGWKLDFQTALTALQEAVAANRPVTLMGTAFNYVHLLDELAAKNLRLKLPAGSCVLETGGYKGRSRVVSRPELHAQIAERLGVAANRIISEYGMSELSSQAYDRRSVSDSLSPQRGEGRGEGCESPKEKGYIGVSVFHFPPWARAQIINPETGRECGEAETGLIRIFDLANVYSVMAVQTEDLGVRRGDGFELLGRAALAETRGCSLMSI